jgi:hypothetical protein
MGTDAAFDTALEELAERIAALTPIVTRRADDYG